MSPDNRHFLQSKFLLVGVGGGRKAVTYRALPHAILGGEVSISGFSVPRENGTGDLENGGGGQEKSGKRKEKGGKG